MAVASCIHCSSTIACRRRRGAYEHGVITCAWPVLCKCRLVSICGKQRLSWYRATPSIIKITQAQLLHKNFTSLYKVKTSLILIPNILTCVQNVLKYILSYKLKVYNSAVKIPVVIICGKRYLYFMFFHFISALRASKARQQAFPLQGVICLPTLFSFSL